MTSTIFTGENETTTTFIVVELSGRCYFASRLFDQGAKARGFMKGTAIELYGRLAEAEDLERAIDAGEFPTLIDFRKALQARVTKMHRDLISLDAINALLSPKTSGDEVVLCAPRVLH